MRIRGCVAAAAMLWAAVAGAETRVHGADSLFAAPTLKLAWAVVRGRSESETRVVIRIVNAKIGRAHV